ncbi:hypothetical protein pdam_00004693 [Pocillopora damicornis]|uniref:Uncharacterized protein n=1 Tax=Pocillopora damicornis TaxID=46731 RepID=A0A3M6UC79_POCDA|nr:hypothetical protein pdam_00004693 [Pocillopora damicornis]
MSPRKGPLQDNTNAILNLPSDDTAAMLSKSYKPETKGPTCNHDIDWVCIPCTAQVRDLSFEPAVESTRRDSWEDVGRKDQSLRTVERLIKPSQRKRHVIGTKKKIELGWRRCSRRHEMARNSDMLRNHFSPRWCV